MRFASDRFVLIWGPIELFESVERQIQRNFGDAVSLPPILQLPVESTIALVDCSKQLDRRI